jgi:hypothetical protein
LSLWYLLPFVTVMVGLAVTTGTIVLSGEIRGNVRVCSVVVRQFTEKRALESF